MQGADQRQVGLCPERETLHALVPWKWPLAHSQMLSEKQKKNSQHYEDQCFKKPTWTPQLVQANRIRCVFGQIGSMADEVGRAASS